MQDILGHFAQLLRFSGRERAGSFWPYAGVVFGLMMTASFVVFVPEIFRTFIGMQQFAVEHPESATITQGPGHYEISIEGAHPELMPDFAFLSGAMAAVAVVSVVLLAAAVTRRLHDAGRSGVWGLLPLPFLFCGFALMANMFASLGTKAEPDFGQILLLFANNAIYMGTLVLLVILLVRRGEANENRFGPKPA
ncbi:MAG: DUF805 domain-containing protein [Alteraurantiacibacter sp.]